MGMRWRAAWDSVTQVRTCAGVLGKDSTSSASTAIMTVVSWRQRKHYTHQAVGLLGMSS